VKGKKEVIPVIIGATGTISKTLKKYMNNMPGEHEDKELQKTTILGTAHVQMKVKQSLYGPTTGPYDSRRLGLLDVYKIGT
jgi:hypothetical protein